MMPAPEFAIKNPNILEEPWRATIGGLGLTGVIEWVEIQLAQISSSYLDVETLPFDNVEAFWALIAAHINKAPGCAGG
jgi:hypothetical protein